MNKRNVLIGLLLLAAGALVHAQRVSQIDVSAPASDEDGPVLRLTGEATGMVTLGFADDDQAYTSSNDSFAPGFYYLDNIGNFVSGKNGYYSVINFSFLFNPVSYVDIYMKILAQYRPGSPYIPVQLEDNSAKTFDNFVIDSAYGRINAVKGLGFDIPLDIWLKAGKYDTTSAHYNRVSRFGAESVMGTMKTMNRYALQFEAAYALTGIEAISAVVTTNLRANDALAELFDEDKTAVIKHGSATGETVLPIHLAVRMKNLSLPVGELSAELLYANNAMDIFSGHSLGMDLGLVVDLDTLKIPVGLGVVFHEKNIDVLARTSVDSLESAYSYLYSQSGYNQFNDINTVSLRQALRFGFGAGVQWDILENLKAEFNAGFALSNIAHIYRDTISLPSLSVDLRATLQDRYFIGGGIFLGTLTEASWYTSNDVENSYDISTHIFTMAENMGFEAFGGIQMGKARFVLGYNINKGLSMNNSIESVPEAQIKYKQKDTEFSDGLFERGGFFTKLGISW